LARPLEGRGIVITRPAGQAAELASLLEARGARALRFPTLEIHDLPDWQLPELEGFDFAVFASPSAVQKVFERIASWPQGPRAAAIGRGTRRELERRGATDVLAPEAGGDSEALLALGPMHDVAGKRIVVFRGEGGRELLGETLGARGAQVAYVECYRRVRPQADNAPLLEAWQRGEVDAVTTSSAQGLDNLLEMLGEAGRPHLLRTPLFVTHERIAEHARQHAFAQVIVGGPGDAELAARLVAYFDPRMSEETAPPRSRSKVPVLLLVAIVLAAALAALFWFDARERIDATQQELARRLRDIENDAREARSVARQAQEALRDAQGKLGQLEAKVAESQSQQVALEALYQDLSRNRDEWQLAEIEQVLTIASQQLQLAGNVRAALLALQLAEARLARAEQPQFLPIRRALAQDIERLKALPALDLPGMSLRLDRLVAQVDAMPLAYEERGERASAAKQAKASEEGGFWSRLGAEVWGELRQLVVVRKLSDPEPPLLPPSQAYFLRENLRLRLLNARLTLLTRDEAGYRADLRAAQAWIERYFDAQSKQTADALAQLKELSSATLSFEMPSIAQSLEAVRGFKSRREPKPQ
jgi:uroporphyrinogen III methyltransferase / synthase